jgi:hypothetical protein
MPNSMAMRDNSLPYNAKVQDEILKFLGSQIKHDYLQGSRDVNLDLSVSEAAQLYNAGSSIRSMAESGQLQQLHERCMNQQQAVQDGYIKVMDSLDRVLQQVSEAEHDIYEELLDSGVEDLNKINNGQQGDTIFNALAFSESTSPMENYEIVRRVAETKGDSDVVLAERNLK